MVWLETMSGGRWNELRLGLSVHRRHVCGGDERVLASGAHGAFSRAVIYRRGNFDPLNFGIRHGA